MSHQTPVMSPQKPAAMPPDDFRALLKAAGLNQGQAAKELDVTRRTVVRWVTGETPIDKRTALYIRSVLGKKKPR